ncbi:MAG TPA: hypothetical protein VFH48_16705, partial [Chloroflexota bacterium]|nr:hypothetical protein [Chloroflexota bacterium]
MVVTLVVTRPALPREALHHPSVVARIMANGHGLGADVHLEQPSAASTIVCPATDAASSSGPSGRRAQAPSRPDRHAAFDCPTALEVEQSTGDSAWTLGSMAVIDRSKSAA